MHFKVKFSKLTHLEWDFPLLTIGSIQICFKNILEAKSGDPDQMPYVSKQ